MMPYSLYPSPESRPTALRLGMELEVVEMIEAHDPHSRQAVGMATTELISCTSNLIDKTLHL